MNRIRTLDGLRGLAIAIVVAGHVAANYQPLSTETRSWVEVFANAGMGVQIFFVLSGYLITRLLLDERDRTGKIRLDAFYRRRGLRILPAFYVFLAGLAVWTLFIGDPIPAAFWWPAATFTWNYAFNWVDWSAGNAWCLAHTWSLAMEAQFYLLWPALFLRLRAAAMLPLVVVVFLLSPVIRAASYWFFIEQRGYLGMMLHTGADSLLAGCAVAMLVRLPRIKEFLQRHGNVGLTIALVWIFLLGPLAVHQIRGFAIVAGITLNAIAAAWMVAQFHLAPPAWVRRVFGTGLMPALGTISYSLYLWQQIFVRPDGWLAEGRVILPVLASLIFAGLSYWLVERPFLKRRGAPSTVLPSAAPEKIR